MISSYSLHAKDVPKRPAAAINNSYGNLGLNKPPLAKNISEVSAGLDSFLSQKSHNEKPVLHSQKNSFDQVNSDEDLDHDSFEVEKGARDQNPTSAAYQTVKNDFSRDDFEKQKRKIEELESKLSEIVKKVDKFSRIEPSGLYQLRTTLRSLDITEQYIQKLIRKATFEFKEEDLSNDEMIFEFALREMLHSISVEMPLFSSLDSDKRPVVTVLISETSSGQSTMVMKLGSLKKNSVVIRNVKVCDELKKSISEQLLNIEIINVSSIAEIMSETRKNIEKGKSVFIDYKNFQKEFNETKKFVEGLKRSFDHVEILVSLSAIHSELYNKKVLSTYKTLVDGLIYSHLDLCLNFGAIFNALEGEKAIPAKFFGTGPVMPDDIEAASAERILDSIFKFD
ncbi:MAG: hypothetical protein A2328_08395 [Bdellovibrionales bacterium RIFOXYB2_FULL_36_6]|nr:MAG: hypothetical protein A2328_08395 [Bdellovibrionales bacterium RIFOXYB2_FULL_36_6]